MKRRRIEKIFWIAVGLIVIFTMLVWTVNF